MGRLGVRADEGPGVEAGRIGSRIAQEDRVLDDMAAGCCRIGSDLQGDEVVAMLSV